MKNMLKQSLQKRLFHFFFVIVMVGIQGCGGPGGAPQKPVLGGNSTFQLHGSTDDGDDTNGPATQYRSPRNKSNDAQTTAQSTPRTYRDIAAAVQAKTGNNAIRLAVALANTKSISSFTVANKITCRLLISSAGSVSLTSAKGSYQVVARIRTGAITGAPVRGSDIQGNYEFEINNANPRILDLKRSGQPNGTITNGGVILRVDRGNGFVLTPGNYTLEFELTVQGQADTDANLDIQAQVDML